MADMLQKLLVQLKLGDDAAVNDEITALLSIYGDDSIEPHTGSRPPSIVEHPAASSSSASHHAPTYFSIKTSLPSPHDDIPLRLLVTLSPSYPETAPQLQVQTIYLGDHQSDYLLYGDILRVFMSEGDWQPGDAALFDGIERAREIALRWYTAKEAAKPAMLPATPDHRGAEEVVKDESPTSVKATSPNSPTQARAPSPTPTLPRGVQIISSEPIIDRKSIFVGWAAIITSPDQVDPILSYLKLDRKVARATCVGVLRNIHSRYEAMHRHNIYAWRCRTADGILHQDNDDDGETAAGSRLAHLLHILNVDNALVICSRWYGGIPLSSDRFKHINAAARAALDAANLIPEQPHSKHSKHSAKHGKH